MDEQMPIQTGSEHTEAEQLVQGQLQDLADGLIATLNHAKGQITESESSMPDGVSQEDAA